MTDGANADDPIDVSVVVMTYNERETLGGTVAEISEVLREIPGHHEVIVINDGSTNGSAQIADRLAATSPEVRVIHHPVNAGLGGVYRTGFSQARGRFLTFFPADGQFPASIIPDFFGTIAGADFVLGYLADRRGPVFGRLLSATERVLYRGLFGRLPRFQGIFMCRTSVIRAIPLRSAGRGWAIVMELMLRADRGQYRLVNRPTPIRPRTAGHSKVRDVRTIAANTRQMIALRWLL